MLSSVILSSVLVACASNPPPPRPAPVVRTVRVEPRVHRVAHRPEWENIGDRWVDGRADRDVIHVGAREGRFRRIMLTVEDSALEMFDVRVHFGDGSVFSPPTRLVFGEGTRTREIDLPGGNRVIRSVEFRYGNLPGGGRARVELWAQ
jgi:hypothetical protein